MEKKLGAPRGRPEWERGEWHCEEHEEPDFKHQRAVSQDDYDEEFLTNPFGEPARILGIIRKIR